jgi:hypothetical protein
MTNDLMRWHDEQMRKERDFAEKRINKERDFCEERINRLKAVYDNRLNESFVMTPFIIAGFVIYIAGMIIGAGIAICLR